MYIVLRVPYTCNFIAIDSTLYYVKYQLSRQSNIKTTMLCNTNSTLIFFQIRDKMIY